MSLLIEALFFSYVGMGALLWILMLVAQEMRVQAGDRLPMDFEIVIFALVALLSSWPFVPWKEVREDLDLVWRKG